MVQGNYLYEVSRNTSFSMERNYDEIISEMLIQIDRHTEELSRHTEELSRHTEELTKHSQEMSKHSQELIAVHMEQGQINKAMLTKLEAMEKIDNHHLEQLVHSATILDRIIRKNDLRV